MKKIKDFCSELGIAMEDAENRLFEIRPNDGGYFIDEEIKVLPTRKPPDRRSVAWFRKSANEEER